MSDPVLMSPWIPVIAALGGAVVVGAAGLINNLINQKAEEQKHVRSLIFNAAIENWKMQWEWGKLKREDDLDPFLLPLDASLLHMSKLSNMLFTQNINADNLEDHIRDMSKFSDLLEKVYKDIESSHR